MLIDFNDNVNLYSIYKVSAEFLEEVFSHHVQKSLFLLNFILILFLLNFILKYYFCQIHARHVPLEYYS